ncbi:hypothetical protein [Streptomyces hydrogenans]|uniref:hypothetical protein n=1 Tax=Streptomyces hydrogenans TaxID=1873719 RepID=UPI0035E1E0B2
MNVSLAAAGNLVVTLDVFTGLVVASALAIAWLVFRWTAPTTAVHQTSKGERLMWAVAAAASVIVVGSYLGDGLRGIERSGENSTEKPQAAVGMLI